ncbi:hypothetical protein LPJ72_002754 [Coemansia sp. Benny D160-2]|nr:hypothetical protein LPJ72_002754 [Coemansia sp. Benny D160-2]
MAGGNTLLQIHDLLAGSQPRVNRSDIYDKISGKLKKRAPNAYMLFRLQLIKYFKGTGHKPDQINSIISRLWGNLDSSNKQNYILVSRKIQRCLDHGANVEPFFSIDSYGKVLRSIPDIFEAEGRARVAKKKKKPSPVASNTQGWWFFLCD